MIIVKSQETLLLEGVSLNNADPHAISEPT